MWRFLAKVVFALGAMVRLSNRVSGYMFTASAMPLIVPENVTLCEFFAMGIGGANFGCSVGMVHVHP
jgi:hypothetical protein